MKFWFGQKKDKSAPAPKALSPATPAVKETPGKPAAASVDDRPQVEILPTPAPLSNTTNIAGNNADNQKPLQPATTMVRPKANQKVLYYQLMNGLYDAVLILDDVGNIVDCNERVNQILGYSREEMWDMQVSTVVKGIGPQIFQQMRDALHNNHQVLINAKCIRKDGETFQGEVGVCIMHLTRGENLVFTIRNVEKRIASVREQLMKELRPNEVKTRKINAVRVVAKGGADAAKPAAPGDAPKSDAGAVKASTPLKVVIPVKTVHPVAATATPAATAKPAVAVAQAATASPDAATAKPRMVLKKVSRP